MRTIPSRLALIVVLAMARTTLVWIHTNSGSCASIRVFTALPGFVWRWVSGASGTAAALVHRNRWVLLNTERRLP